MTGSVRLTAEMLERAVIEYGRTLTLPPGGGMPPDLELVAEDAHPGHLHVVMSLWTDEEGQSDFSLELILILNNHGLIDIQVDGLHVL
jgi:hypothetical protein